MPPPFAIDSATTDAVDEVFTAFHARGTALGVAYGIVANGTPVHAGAVGSASIGGPDLGVDSVLRIASMTKSFTAATALLLRDEGQLHLDEPISTYVPELVGLRLPTGDSPQPTTRMLLTMAGGLPSDDPWADREEAMSADEFSALLAGGLSFTAPPGVVFEYSNLSYAIVGRALANIAGEPFHDLVRRRLIEPLGLTSTGFAVADVPAEHLVSGYFQLEDEWIVEPFSGPGAFSPIGGIFSSVRDLATWVGGFTDAFPPRDAPEVGHPLSRASRREMQQLQRFNDVTVPAARPGSATPPIRARTTGYGFGLTVSYDTRWGQQVGHGGGYPGYGSHMRWHPTTGLGVVVLGNARYMPAGELAIAALEIVLASVGAPPARITRWDRTREMQRAAQQLVIEWDDALADRIFAANVDQDLPRDAHRAEVQRVTEQLGAISNSVDDSPLSEGASDIEWWLDGDGGRARIGLTLTPHAQPLVQSLDVSFVGPVSSALAQAVAAAVGELPADGQTAPPVVECIEWTNEHSATFKVRIGVDEWRVTVTVDSDTGAVTDTVVKPTPPSVHRFEVSADAPAVANAAAAAAAAAE